MDTSGLLTIGSFARLSWLSPRALRLYEQQGLLVPAIVDERTGYRWYRPGQLDTARLVARLRRLDMPLARITAIVTAGRAEAVALLDEYWTDEEYRVAARRELVSHLRIRLLGDEGSLHMYDIQVRDVPEQLVLTEQRHVRVQDLPQWIDESIARLLKAAAGHGDGLAGPCFIVYHGEVNEESDGPVEICLPITPDPAGPPEAASRIEPAHREAYTRITKAQVAFPQILSAYDAVAAWTDREPVTRLGSPREVYFADFAAAAPDELCCDIAQPIE
ncbi:MerR family transcriptional regulator [Dactylosporangium vinaceum]|uniref:MerR family transcriptional regulator n=1 Tax=Dactylosporangium vinaceum TaxID=53362 RepID=A0ABV5MHP9_9ACTN|nr:MerR family transcriptional regulator [Dactylosporangium vinaceum]